MKFDQHVEFGILGGCSPEVNPLWVMESMCTFLNNVLTASSNLLAVVDTMGVMSSLQNFSLKTCSKRYQIFCYVSKTTVVVPLSAFLGQFLCLHSEFTASISVTWLCEVLPACNVLSLLVTEALKLLPFAGTVHCQYVA